MIPDLVGGGETQDPIFKENLLVGNVLVFDVVLKYSMRQVKKSKVIQ